MATEAGCRRPCGTSTRRRGSKWRSGEARGGGLASGNRGDRGGVQHDGTQRQALPRTPQAAVEWALPGGVEGSVVSPAWNLSPRGSESRLRAHHINTRRVININSITSRHQQHHFTTATGFSRLYRTGKSAKSVASTTLGGGRGGGLWALPHPLSVGIYYWTDCSRVIGGSRLTRLFCAPSGASFPTRRGTSRTFRTRHNDHI